MEGDRAGAALLNGQVWLLGLVNFILLGAGFGLIFFVPDLVQERTGYTNFEVGLLAAIPFAIATVAMLWVARRADGAPSRRPYVAAMGAVGAVGTLITAYVGSPLLLTLGITLSAVGVLSAIPVFWTLPTSFLSGTAAAAGIALIAVIGNLGRLRRPGLHRGDEGLHRRLRDPADRAGRRARAGIAAGPAGPRGAARRRWSVKAVAAEA